MVASVIHVFDDIELIYLNQLVTLLFNNDQLIKPIDGLCRWNVVGSPSRGMAMMVICR
jgi:hypothetical protein